MADYLYTAASSRAVSVAEAKRHLNVSSTFDDTLIGELVDAATDLLEKRCSRAFVWQTRKCTMEGFSDSRYVHDREIFPPVSPLASVTSISYVSATGTTTTMPSTDYIASTHDRPGRISEAYDATWPATYGVANDVTLTYVAGHSSSSTGVGYSVKQAIKMLSAHWYRNRENVLVGTISKELEWTLDSLLESELVERYG